MGSGGARCSERGKTMLVSAKRQLGTIEFRRAISGERVPSKIYIVVPVFNRKFYTKGFLQCMRRQTFRNFETIVVDDGSTDGTAELIGEEFREVKLLRGDGNLWWTGAVNMGIRYAMLQALAIDAILIINDDLEVDSDYLEKLYGLWKSMPQALIGSVSVDIKNPEMVYEGGYILNWWTAKLTVLNRGENLSKFEKDYQVDVSFLTGRGTLIPIQVFHKIGLYDDRHFQQCGDTELTVRAKKAGYRLVVSYSVVVKSHHKASSNVNVSTNYSMKDLTRYLFNIKSDCRLKYRFFFSLKTARNPVQCLSFLIFDLLRITWHFFLRLRFI
jgi:N-acetylglucosaminyl-diphospho-decaprenol L-rhamnosyltransferase